MSEFEKSLGDKNRFKAYETAAAAIAAYPKRLSSGEEARKSAYEAFWKLLSKDLNGVGEKIAKKVDEILKTGTLKKVAKYQADPKISAIHLLCSVSGVGPAAAKYVQLIFVKDWDIFKRTYESFFRIFVYLFRKWVESGITTLEQLKKEKLNNHQKVRDYLY